MTGMLLILLAQLIYSYTQWLYMFPLATFKWLDLPSCKTMTDMLAPVEHTNSVLSAWNSTLDQNDIPLA